MASGWTNKGAFSILGAYFQGVTLPTNFYVCLVTNAVTPTTAINTLSELTQVTGGTGYTTNGYSLTPNVTDFDVHTEVDGSDWALIEVKDVVWTASGGSISNAYHAVITDDNVTPGSRLVLAFADLTGPVTVSDGQTLTLEDIQFRLTTA